MTDLKLTVHHWRFEDGITPINPGNRFGEMIPERGWYCWIYPNDDREFEAWMDKHCPTSEYTHRFNGGDPMYTTYIKDEQEATYFTLRWLGR